MVLKVKDELDGSGTLLLSTGEFEDVILAEIVLASMKMLDSPLAPTEPMKLVVLPAG